MDTAAISRNRPFVIKIHLAMVGKWFRNDLSTELRNGMQTPGTQYVGLFEQEVPVKKRGIVFKNDESRHPTTTFESQYSIKRNLRNG